MSSMKARKARNRNFYQQNAPSEFTENCVTLCDYAKTFFGFGSWEADYWLIGLEECGCMEEKNEFCKRYNAWCDMRKAELVDLRKYFYTCKISNTPDWCNQTWRVLHRICNETGLKIDGLCEHNRQWGGAQNVKRGSRHVALIESIPFPAPNRNGWPYSGWKKLHCMKTRRSCKENFLIGRLSILKNKIDNYHPKLVIFYGKIKEVDKFLDWKEIKLKPSNITFHLKQVDGSAHGKQTIICYIKHPSWLMKYGGGYESVQKIACKIKEILTDKQRVIQASRLYMQPARGDARPT